MKKIALIFTLLPIILFSQGTDSTSINKILGNENNNTRFNFGGYAQIDYAHKLNDTMRYNGFLDVTRLVTLFSYKFNEKTHFFSEIEFEHVNELYVEQAYINHEIKPFLNFRAGLLLVPFGIINEYHEPPTFHSVNRPYIDKVIAPTTWREIGVGFAGNVDNANLKYQIYLINGLLGYNNKALFNGKDGIRGGRQKGAKAIGFNPNFTSKIEYYGIQNLNLGFAGYFGKSETNLNNSILKSNKEAIAKADSSEIGMAMIGIDAIYKIKGIIFKSQFYYTNLSNTTNYNKFSGSDIGNKFLGYYLELAYNYKINQNTSLTPFVKYEFVDTHFDISEGITKNDKYNKTFINVGLNLFLTSNSVLKADIELGKSKSDASYLKIINFGLGIMF